MDDRLLSQHDAPPVSVINRDGGSLFVITCEHAGNAVPRALGDLGLTPDELRRHIAWDLGARATALRLAKTLDAPLVLQHYSRLVIDCNRPTGAISAIPTISDGTAIPGNDHLSPADREARLRAIHKPFHDAVTALLDQREALPTPPALIAFHSFTPRLSVNPSPRPWDLGLLYNRDDRLAKLVDGVLAGMEHRLTIAHNQPYTVSDATDYTLPVHGEARGLFHLLLEVRNDLIEGDDGIATWSRFLGDVLSTVEPKL